MFLICSEYPRDTSIGDQIGCGGEGVGCETCKEIDSVSKRYQCAINGVYTTNKLVFMFRIRLGHLENTNDHKWTWCFRQDTAGPQNRMSALEMLTEY